MESVTYEEVHELQGRYLDAEVARRIGWTFVQDTPNGLIGNPPGVTTGKRPMEYVPAYSEWGKASRALRGAMQRVEMKIFGHSNFTISEIGEGIHHYREIGRGCTAYATGGTPAVAYCRAFVLLYDKAKEAKDGS